VPDRAAARWNPTAGTRAAGKISRQRPGGRRVRYTNGRLEYRDDPPVLEWPFAAPMGIRTVIGEFTRTDVVTMSATCHRCGADVYDVEAAVWQVEL
jgi:hypothetical protein